MKLHPADTNYRTLSAEIGEKELKLNYTPSAPDRQFLDKTAKRRWAHLSLAIHLMVFRNLGYFVPLVKVPERIRDHIGAALGHTIMPPASTFETYDRSGPQRGHIAALRTYLGVQPFRDKDRTWLKTMAVEAAESKHAVGDILSALVEQLVHHRFEIPPFDLLKHAANRAHTIVTERHLGKIANALTPKAKKVIDELFKRRSGEMITGWQYLKREPKFPSSNEAREMLHHVQHLKQLADQMPSVDLPQPKLRAYRHWARHVDATELSRMRPTRRYGLAVIYIHAQRGKSLDDIIELFLRLTLNLENTAKRNLTTYLVENAERTDKLIAQLKSTAIACQKPGPVTKRLEGILSSFKEEASLVEAQCTEHLAFANKNYLPFLLKPYAEVRGRLLDCLEFTGIQSANDHSDEWRWLRILLEQLRKSRKDTVTLAELKVTLKPDLNWLAGHWRKEVLLPAVEGQQLLHRRYLELAILFMARDALKSAELFVPKGEEHDDFRPNLVTDDVLNREIGPYCEMTGIEIDDDKHVAQLQTKLASKIKAVDGRMPDNPYTSVVKNHLSIKKAPGDERNPALPQLDRLVKERLTPINIIDLLVDTVRWTKLHLKFKHVSGESGRIKELMFGVVAILFCYGFNIGPAQAERSLRGLSRKQLAYLQEKYTSKDILEEADRLVINAFAKYQLAQLWGKSNSASADGMKWRMHEDNMMATNHIRYGGWGGIGYYLVASNYAALVAHFQTCGVYEATYILDLLIRNTSDVQPDRVHGDTHAQNLVVFALAYLLGIKLMPRIRQLWRMQFSRAEKNHRCDHLEPIFRDNVDWGKIKANMREMMRVAVSIKLGKLAPSDIVRRFGAHNTKNPLYFAFQELGKVVRTMFMLDYIDDVELRKAIQSGTNKSEQFNRFQQWVFFGGQGVITEELRDQQAHFIQFGKLAANLVMLHNVDELTRVFSELQQEGHELTPDLLEAFSPYQMAHINRLGDYAIDLQRKSGERHDTYEFPQLRLPDATKDNAQ